MVSVFVIEIQVAVNDVDNVVVYNGSNDNLDDYYSIEKTVNVYFTATKTIPYQDRSTIEDCFSSFLDALDDDDDDDDGGGGGGSSQKLCVFCSVFCSILINENISR